MRDRRSVNMANQTAWQGCTAALTRLTRPRGFDNGGRGTMQVSMHIEVPLCHVTLDQQLILLGIPPTQHQHILACHKPIEALKPVRLARSHWDGDLLGLCMVKMS